MRCIGAGCGSYMASRWTVDKGHAAVRVFVVCITAAVLAIFAIQWFV